MTSLCIMKRGSNEIFSFPLACPIGKAWWLRLGCCPDCSVDRLELARIQLPNATIVFNVMLPEVPVLAARDNY